MVQMATEKGNQNLLQPRDPWEITPELIKRARKARGEIEEARKKFEQLIILCSQDGTKSRFDHYEGAFPIVKAVFKCEKGHKFFY